MNLRKEIEKFAIWYIPILIISHIFIIVFQGHVLTALSNIESIVSLRITVSTIGHLLNGLAAGIWLYLQTRKTVYQSLVWGLFGLTANLMAVLIYLALQIYYSVQTSNKALKSQAMPAGTPKSGAP